MISLINLKKVFKKGKKKVEAVKDVSFEINDNEIFALLGPNGAGKTTTMRMMSTLLETTNGEVKYDNVALKGNELEIRRKISFLTSEIRLYGELTPNELALFYGKLYDLDDEKLKENKSKLFDYFGITEFADRKYETFSTGMKQKTSIAICLIHDPNIIIFDEPTNGLDILTQRLVEDYLLLLKEQGKCIIISTHILDIVNRIADRVGVIIDGKSVFCGTTEEMCTSQQCKDINDAFLKLYKDNHSEVN